VSAANHGIVTPGQTFAERATSAVADPDLQGALRNLDRRLHTARAVADTTPELKDRAAAIRREVLADLDGWLDRLEASLTRVGAVVHRADTPAAARKVVLDLVRLHDARTVVKSKSMATEEIDLGAALEAVGIEVVETDLGEYIVQVAGERPSHMITPAIHKTLPQIAAVLGTRADGPLPVEREALAAWTHDHLRPAFLRAEVGISGVNFAAADTGTITIVTNEGNGRLCTTWPRIHVAVMPIEKVIPRFADLGTLVPLLTRSATGQSLSNYLSMITGPRRAGESDGPEELHVVFLDHNRRALLGTPYEEMLACIRCGACLNVCPVYRKVSGHAYDAVYSGPMGKILTPLLSLGEEGRDLPGASSLCGACTEACPVEIPLADLLVRLRADLRVPGRLRPLPAPAGVAASAGHVRLPGEGFAWPTARSPLASRAAPRSAKHLLFTAWSRAWASPAGYRASAGAARIPGRLGREWARRVPLATGWTATRDLPLPDRRSFRARWAERAPGASQW
jgi:L-lactate dehydrogenase complex protein LldF